MRQNFNCRISSAKCLIECSRAEEKNGRRFKQLYITKLFHKDNNGLKCKEESILMETLSVHCGVCQWSTILDSVAVVNLREVDKVLTYFLFTGTKMHP